MKITISGVDEAIADIDHRVDLMHSGIDDELGRSGDGMKIEMIRTHTFQNRTYRLEGSIGYEVYTFIGNHAALTMFANEWYASLVEEGHPGPPPARPYPFFWPVWFAMTPGILERLQAVVTATIEHGVMV